MSASPTCSSRFWRWLLLGTSLLSALAGLLCAFLYYDLYWRYRDSFNELGRYYDPADNVVYDVSAGIFVVPAIALLGLAMLSGWRRWKTRW